MPIIATMAEESNLRLQQWLAKGCNSFDGNIASKPMSFWKQQDVLRYIKINNLPIASVYGEIVLERTLKKARGGFSGLRERTQDYGNTALRAADMTRTGYGSPMTKV